ncbi:MAG: RluA family pseudouridine synthase [Ferruginibacter sp.]
MNTDPVQHISKTGLKKLENIIVFEDDIFVALNKPTGMLSIPDRAQSEKSLKEMLIEKYGNIYTVHRLDKETSGLILFAKTEEAHKYFSLLFEERLVQKFYAGIVLGVPEKMSDTIDAPISEHPLQKGLMVVHKKGKASSTSYEVLEAHKQFSLVKFQLHTGRTHQIRVHCKNMGHPLACDALYGDGKPVKLSTFKKKYKLSKHEDEERPIINRLALHAYQLSFKTQDGKEMTLTADMPKEFRALMQQLGKL